MNTQKVKPFWQIIDELNDSIFNINKKTISNARSILDCKYGSDWHVRGIVIDGLSDIKPILAKSMVEFRAQVKNEVIINMSNDLETTVLKMIELAEEKIQHCYHEIDNTVPYYDSIVFDNKVQVFDVAKKEFEAINTTLGKYVGGIKQLLPAEIDRKLRTLDIKIMESIIDIVKKLRMGANKNIKPNKNDFHSD